MPMARWAPTLGRFLAWLHRFPIAEAMRLGRSCIGEPVGGKHRLTPFLGPGARASGPHSADQMSAYLSDACEAQ